MCLSLSKSDPRKCIKCIPNSDGSGTPFVKYCPDGELWNDVDKICDSPYNCGCDFSVTITTTTEEPETPSTPIHLQLQRPVHQKLPQKQLNQQQLRQQLQLSRPLERLLVQ